MTGRAAGYCAGYGMPGYANPWGGRWYRPWCWGGGWGWFGRGFGPGWRNWYYATGLTGWQRAAMGWPAAAYGLYGPAPYATAAQPGDEKQSLQAAARQLERELAEIRRRLQELESSEKSE